MEIYGTRGVSFARFLRVIGARAFFVGVFFFVI